MVKNIHTTTNKDFKTRYRKEKLLGTGSFGRVYAGFDKIEKHPVAIKEFFVEGNLFAEILKELEDEWSIVSKLDHPNLVKYYEYYYVDKKVIYLIMELIVGSELRNKDYMGDFWNISIDIFDALSYLHQKGVAHRDVKSENIIVKSNGDAVLVDYGLACLVKENIKGKLSCKSGSGTPYYISPELYRSEYKKDPYIFYSNDVWGAGATIYEIYFGTFLIDDIFPAKKSSFSFEDIRRMTKKIKSPIITDPKNVYEEFIDYVLNVSYKNRPTAVDCYNVCLDIIQSQK